MTKILIVEDDIFLLKLYQEVFTKADFQVEVAEDGQQAIQKASEFVPDIVLLDLMLPYVDGFGVLENIKSNDKTKRAKVVVFTNLDSEKQREKAESLGADKFVVKAGDNPGNILDEVKQLLSSK
jgi:DNA-binding response OmpR family regulator